MTSLTPRVSSRQRRADDATVTATDVAGDHADSIRGPGQHRPRVALVAHDLHSYGGIERYFSEFVRCGHQSVDFVVVSSRISDDLLPLVEWRRISVPQRPFALKFAVFFLRAGWTLRRETVDLVHTMGAIVPNRVDLANVQFCHAGFRAATGALAPPRSTPLRRLNTALARMLALLAERFCYRPGRMGILVAPSRGVMRELRAHYPGVPIVIAPNGVETNRFRPDARVRTEVRLAEGVPRDDIVALFVGGDWDRKGLGIAIRALAEANSVTARRLRLWVVGTGDVDRFATLAAQCGVAELVSFLGLRVDTERFYQAADVLVFPSLYEGFPLVALEAAASGLPIVGTAVNGVEELVGEGGAGVLVARTPEAVGSALARLASDEVVRRRAASAARRRGEQYSWPRAAQSILALYRQVLSDSLVRRNGL